MDELLNKAAEKMGMPPALAKRSAQARADKEGITLEAVLAEWAGEEVADDAGGQEQDEPVAPTDTMDAGALVTATEGADAPPAAVTAPDPVPTDSPAASGGAQGEVSTEYLVGLAAASKRMPEKLVRSSAEARARNAGTSIDSVLATWAGVDLDDLRSRAEAGLDLPVVNRPAQSTSTPPSPADEAAQPKAPQPTTPQPTASEPSTPESPAPEAPAREPQPTSAPPSAAAAGAVSMSMDELLEKVAEAKGMPVLIAKRSAEARAKKTGEPLEAVLAEWAGVDPATVGAPSGGAAAPQPAEQAPTPVEPAAQPDAAPSVDDVEVIAAVAAERPDEPSGEAESPVPARRGGYPTWLAAAFIIIPLLAVTYILVSPNGPDCGTAGQLSVDPVTGLAVNCDGSEYGSSTVDFLSMGAGIYAQCAACHGADGGGGAGPAFSGGAVLATFPAGQCNDHVVWVTLGTANFPDPTYGATNKPVGGVGLMPGYDGVLTPEQIASVVLYERVSFGGQDRTEAEIDCGLVEPEDETVEASQP